MRKQLNNWFTFLLAFHLVLAVHLFAGHPAQAAPRTEGCQAKDVSYVNRSTSIAASKLCADGGEEAFQKPAKPTQAKPTNDDAKYIESRAVSACIPGQAANPDFGGCHEQQEKFCPEGAWLQTGSTDTRDPEGKTIYTAPYCATDAADSPGDASGGVPVTIDEVRTLLVVKPEIESDNGGRGVRNAETNFYTLAEPVSLRTTIDGQLIELRATPVSFTWDYGDGSAPVTTTEGGHAQPEFNTPTPTSHVYEKTGSYTVGLTTQYIGEYRVEGGDWQLIPGTITMDSTPVTADIWRTVTRNVADDCSADSSAWGCTGPIEAPNGG